MKTGSEELSPLDSDGRVEDGMSRKNQNTKLVCPEMSNNRIAVPNPTITPETPIEELPMLMEVKEVAAYWRVNPKTVYDMINRGELLSQDIGKRVKRIHRNNVVQSSSGNSRVSRSPRRK